MTNIKSDIAWVLQTIASKDLRDEYAKDIGFNDRAVIDELICCWADDLYHPSSEIFNKQFDKRELVVFEEFNKIFDKYADDKSQKSWPMIMTAANSALKKLNWDKDEYLKSDYKKNS